MNNNGWDDIGYNFIIGEDGNVYEGRGWKYLGTHAPAYNGQSIGICVIGDFTSKYFVISTKFYCNCNLLCVI